MPHNNVENLPLCEGYENTKRHWFIHEMIWDSIDITNETKQMAQFARVLWEGPSPSSWIS